MTSDIRALSAPRVATIKFTSSKHVWSASIARSIASAWPPIRRARFNSFSFSRDVERASALVARKVCAVLAKSYTPGRYRLELPQPSAKPPG